MKVLRIVPALVALAALSVNAEAGPNHHHHHHDGSGAAVGLLGAGIFLGALAATAAADSSDREYVYDGPPPPPPPSAAYYGERDRGGEASESIAACRQGMLDAARKYGAYDAEIGDIYSVRDTRFGQIVRADIRIDYRGGDSRTSPVTCEVEDGVLVSARSDY